MLQGAVFLCFKDHELSLRAKLEALGGEVVTNFEDAPDYVNFISLEMHDAARMYAQLIEQGHLADERQPILTHLWLDRCVELRELVPPDDTTAYFSAKAADGQGVATLVDKRGGVFSTLVLTRPPAAAGAGAGRGGRGRAGGGRGRGAGAEPGSSAGGTGAASSSAAAGRAAAGVAAEAAGEGDGGHFDDYGGYGGGIFDAPGAYSSAGNGDADGYGDGDGGGGAARGSGGGGGGRSKGFVSRGGSFGPRSGANHPYRTRDEYFAEDLDAVVECALVSEPPPIVHHCPAVCTGHSIAAAFPRFCPVNR